MFPSCRRVVMTVGDSRVGKSTVIKLLIELFLSQHQTVKIYNHDNRNKFKAYEGIVPIENLNFFIDNPDLVLDDLLNDSLDVLFVDMPGQYIEETCNYIYEADFFTVLAELNWKLTFLQPISHRSDCMEYFLQLLDFATDNANYVIVKNQHFDTRFKEYNQLVQQKLPLIGGTEIRLTALHRDHYQGMEDLSKPYSQCFHEQSLYVLYRSYIYQWLKNFFDAVKNNQVASIYLGVSAGEKIRNIAGVF